MRYALVLVLLASTFSCAHQGAAPEEPPIVRWRRGAFPDGMSPQSHFVVVGRGDNIALARADAIKHWMPTRQEPDESAVPDLQSDPESQSRLDEEIARGWVLAPGGGLVQHTDSDAAATYVLLSLPKSPALARLQQEIDALKIDASTLLQAHGSGAAALIEALRDGAKAAKKRRALCGLWQGWTQESCAPDNNLPMLQESLQALAATIGLRAAAPSGFAYAGPEVPVRPLLILCQKGRLDGPRSFSEDGMQEPWPGLPLQVQAPDGLFVQEKVICDDTGVAALAFARAPQDGEQVAVLVDAETLVGSALAGSFPNIAAPLPLHRLTASTIRLRLTVGVQGDAPGGQELVPLARQEMAKALQRGLGPQAQILVESPDVQTQYVGTPGAPSTPDVTGTVRLSWAFASALGGRSLWYEASAAIALAEAPNEAAFSEENADAMQAGIGERHAARQAVLAVAQNAAAAVVKVLQGRYPDSPPPRRNVP